MRIVAAAVPIFLLTLLIAPVYAQEAPKPEAVVEKMAFKLVRGVTNFVTAIGELPKQTYLTVRARGPIGYVVGPLKGVGMTMYRALIGTVDTVFFLVPQPGYYDPLIDPEFVWQGLEDRRTEVVNPHEPEPGKEEVGKPEKQEQVSAPSGGKSE